MKQIIFIASLALISLINIQVLSSQEYNIETKQEENIDGSFTTISTVDLIKRSDDNFPWIDLSISSSINNFRNYQAIHFIFSYVGDSWRLYDRIAFNADGNVFYLDLNGIRETISDGIVAELYHASLPEETARILQSATMIKFQAFGSRVIDNVITFETETVNVLNNFLKALWNENF